jgi:kynureninase
VPVEVTGVTETLRGMRKMAAGDAVNIADGLDQIAHMFAVRADYYCPKKTKALVNSRAIISEGVGFGARTQLSYGGPSAPYAVWVHEDYEAHHDAPTCAGWVTRAVRELRGPATARMRRQFEAKKGLTIGDREVS